MTETVNYNFEKRPKTDFLIGDETAANSLASGAIDEAGVPVEISDADPATGTFWLIVENASGTLDLNIDFALTYDGETGGLKDYADVMGSDITGDGVYPLDLASFLSSNAYNHFITPSVTKSAAETCDVTFYFVSQGA